MDNFAGFDIGQDLRGALNLDGAAWALSALREGPMSRFVVRFMKDVLGGNGRAAEICQSSLEIDADCEGDAEELTFRPEIRSPVQ
jgi:hypothetical protein